MSAPIGQDSELDQIGRNAFGVDDLYRRPGTLAPGEFHIKLFADDETGEVTSFIFEIPDSLDGYSLVFVRGYVTTVDTGDVVEFNVTNTNGSVPMLTTDITVDTSAKSSRTAAIPPVIADPPDCVVAEGDQIQVDLLVAGTEAMGHAIMLRFAPAAAEA